MPAGAFQTQCTGSVAMAKPRVLISSDIGGSDPDDIQSMVHAFLYADKVNLVGLVSTPSKHGGRTTHIHQAIDAYEKDYLKLKTLSSEYPTDRKSTRLNSSH